MSIRETVAKATGMAKKAGAVLSSDKGILRELKKEHGEVSALMKQTQKGDISTRRELFPKIRVELLSHAHAEEDAFYRGLEQHSQIRSLVQEHIQDHKNIEQLVERIESTPYDSTGWAESFDELVTQVEAHVHKEENQLFPKVKDILSDEQLAHMESRFEEQKQRLRERLEASTGAPEKDRGPGGGGGSTTGQTGATGGAPGTSTPPAGMPPGGLQR